MFYRLEEFPHLLINCIFIKPKNPGVFFIENSQFFNPGWLSPSSDTMASTIFSFSDAPGKDFKNSYHRSKIMKGKRFAYTPLEEL